MAADGVDRHAVAPRLADGVQHAVPLRNRMDAEQAQVGVGEPRLEHVVDRLEAGLVEGADGGGADAELLEPVRQRLLPGALDPLVKEMVYIAVSASNGCEYCCHSHTASARAKGMTDAMYGELLSVIGMANQTNAVVNAMQVPVDEEFKA